MGDQRTMNCGVVAFGSATCEDDFTGICVDQGSDFSASFFNAFCQSMAKLIGAGRIPPVFTQEWQHGVDDLGCDTGRGVVIKVIHGLLAHSESNLWQEKRRFASLNAPWQAGGNKVSMPKAWPRCAVKRTVPKPDFREYKEMIISFADTWMCGGIALSKAKQVIT